MTRKNTPEEFFFGAVFETCAAAAGFATLADENELEPRVGTGGITNLETSTVLLLRFALFFAGRLALREDFFALRLTARFAGRFAVARLAGRFAADFFFLAT